LYQNGVDILKLQIILVLSLHSWFIPFLPWAKRNCKITMRMTWVRKDKKEKNNSRRKNGEMLFLVTQLFLFLSSALYLKKQSHYFSLFFGNTKNLTPPKMCFFLVKWKAASLYLLIISIQKQFYSIYIIIF